MTFWKSDCMEIHSEWMDWRLLSSSAIWLLLSFDVIDIGPPFLDSLVTHYFLIIGPPTVFLVENKIKNICF
jgi:hypothetical protein